MLLLNAHSYLWRYGHTIWLIRVSVFFITGREDLAKQKCVVQESFNSATKPEESTPHVKGIKEEEDGMEHLDNEV